jgi:hypothetical protein
VVSPLLAVEAGPEAGRSASAEPPERLMTGPALPG